MNQRGWLSTPGSLTASLALLLSSNYGDRQNLDFTFSGNAGDKIGQDL